MEAVKPPPLRPGDTIGIVAPSSCGPARYPHRVQRGVRFLESLGYRVVLGTHARGCRGYVSGTPEERVADLHAFFADPTVRAIVAAIGGQHACHLLPLLDFDLIRRHPKIVLGYSDVTVLSVAMYATTGLVTFYGPMLLTDFAEYPEPFAYTVDAMLRTLTTAEPVGALAPAPEWTDDTSLDWGTRADLTGPRHRHPRRDWAWLKEGHGRQVEGRLVGGCIESLQHLRGTPFWPDLDRAVLFIESSRAGDRTGGPAWMDALLQDCANMGVFARLVGLLVGRPVRYSAEQQAELHAVLLERTKRYDFPIVTDVDFGHTEPKVTLPIGCRIELDPRARRLALAEAAVGPR